MDSKELNLEIVTKQRSDGLTRQKVYSPEALKVLNAEPLLTAWGWDHGRPIYHRLPMVGEAYQKSYDLDQAMVYLDLSVPRSVGPGTLEVQKNNKDWRILEIQNGVISWRYGEFDVDEMTIDLMNFNSGYGLADGEWQIGYRLFHQAGSVEESPVPGFVIADSNQQGLGNIEVAVDASGETVDHRVGYAIDDYVGTTWWPNAFYGAQGYLDGTHYTVDFLDPVLAETFEIEAEAPKSTANCALYASHDAIVWYRKDQKKSDGNVWTVSADLIPYRYFRFNFWDGTASIANVKYTGEAYFRDMRVLNPTSKAVFFLKDMYEAVEGDYLLLAHFTTKGGAVTSLVDHRRVTYDKYQPVADWVTTFHDEQLRCNFDHVVKYSERFMSPESADFHLYEEMDDSICTGLGKVTLASQEKVPVIRYPNVVGLLPDTSIDAIAIEHVTQPEQDGDLATAKYTDYTLIYSWSIDNGLY